MSREMFECECGKRYVSALAMADCHDQDELEDYDRTHERLFGINQVDNPNILLGED